MSESLRKGYRKFSKPQWSGHQVVCALRHGNPALTAIVYFSEPSLLTGQAATPLKRSAWDWQLPLIDQR